MTDGDYIKELRIQLSDDLKKKYPNKRTGEINRQKSTTEINIKGSLTRDDLEKILVEIDVFDSCHKILNTFLIQLNEDINDIRFEITPNTLKNFFEGTTPIIENLHLYTLYLGYAGWHHFKDVIDEKRGKYFYKNAKKKGIKNGRNKLVQNTSFPSFPNDVEQTIKNIITPLNLKIEELKKTLEEKSRSLVDNFNSLESFDEHIREIEEEIKKNRYVISLKKIGLSAFQKKDYKLAISIFKRVIEIDFYNPRCFYFLGIIYIKKEKYSKAIEVLMKATEFDSKNAEYWFVLGNTITIENKKRERAIIAYENAVRLDQNNIKYKFALGGAYFSLGEAYVIDYEYEKAISAIRRAVSFDRKNSKYWFTLGNVYMSNKKYEEGLNASIKSLMLTKRVEDKAIFQIIWCIQKTMQTTKSLRNYRKVYNQLGQLLKCSFLDKKTRIRLVNEENWCLMKIAQIEKTKNSFNKALDRLNKSAVTQPKSVWISNLIAYCLWRISEIEKNTIGFQKAINKYKESLIFQPKNRLAISGIGWCLLVLKDLKNSKIWLNKIKPKDAHSYTNLGHYELIIKNKNEAIKNYKKSLDSWDYFESFFESFDNDFKFIEPQGVSKEDYQAIKKELKEYCESK